MNKSTKIFISIFAIVLGLCVVAFALIGSLISLRKSRDDSHFPSTDSKVAFDFQNFNSDLEFQNYLEQSQFSVPGMGGMGGMDLSARNSAIPEAQEGAVPAPVGKDELTDSSYRYSETNVQVLGIDEPDIVKTDGTNLYVSIEDWMYYPLMERDMILEKEAMASPGTGSSGSTSPSAAAEELPSDVIDQKIIAPTEPYYPTPLPQKTKVVGALPPETMSVLSKIDFSGNLLINQNTLIIINQNIGIEAYDISDKINPKRIWDIKYQEGFYYTNARLSNGKLYLVLNSYLYPGIPCPLNPIAANGQKVEILCADIYYPNTIEASSSIMNILKVNVETGDVEDSMNYMGDQYQDIFYMSEDNLYLTFPNYIDEYEFIIGYVKAKGSEIISAEDVGKILEVDAYNISNYSKLYEITNIISEYQYSDGVENKNFLNALANYYETIKRDIEVTDIVKIDVKSLDIASKGKIPGRPLNQFSLDEYNGNFRISTTTGSNWLFGISNEKSVNDIYILDENLNILGSVVDMGKGERIYATRFMGDTVYLVTFKQTDPFFVIDLSDASNPQIKGELKIPGYSSYLHQLNERLVIGVGREENNVKLSLFDVSNPSNPQEISKLSLKDTYWTEVESNHHAFMQDPKHEVFFIPAGEKGYIISYSDDTLNTVKEVKNLNAQRALYINDTLYVVGNEKVTAFNELTWEEIKTVSTK